MHRYTDYIQLILTAANYLKIKYLCVTVNHGMGDLFVLFLVGGTPEVIGTEALLIMLGSIQWEFMIAYPLMHFFDGEQC